MMLWRGSPERLGRFHDLDRQFPHLLRLEGFYYYDRHQQNILLLGYFDEQGNWRLSEYAEPGKPATGSFKGSLIADKFVGQWESPDAKRSLPFELRTVKKELRTPPEMRSISRLNQEMAVQSVSQKDYAKAVFYLTMSRQAAVDLVSHEHTQNWEALFQALSEGKRHEFENVLNSCEESTDRDCRYKRGPLAYLAEEDGDFAAAKKTYHDLCVRADVGPDPVTFTCLMYSRLAEQTGDRAAALEGYDFACQRAQSMCSKASGADEAQLITAIKEQKFEVAEKLLEKPLNVNAGLGEPLLGAVFAGNLKLVQMLIQKGADPNLDNGSILDTAIMNNREEIAEFLLDHGADPRTPGDDGVSRALHEAVGVKNIHLLEKLIAKGANVNENDYVGGGTPLQRAAEDNQLEIVKLLLAHGADPTLTAKFHDPPMDAATDPEVKTVLKRAIAECQSRQRKCESPN